MTNFSLYNRSDTTTVSFPRASEEHKITIELVDEASAETLGIPGLTSANFGIVVGYLSKEFEYSSTGNYTNLLGNSFGDSIFLKLLSDETQRNVFNYGYMTKKVYSEGSSPTLNVDFRCYAGSTDSGAHYNALVDPVSIANCLINATLPRVGADALLNKTGLVDAAKSAFGAIKTVVKTAMSGYDAYGNLIANHFGANNQENLDASIDNAQKNTMAISDALNINNLTSRKPPLCNVKIGNVFEKDMMIIKHVDVKFSKEYHDKGVPLYGDFSLVLESLFNASVLGNGSLDSKERIFGSGLNRTNSKSRISFGK